MRKIKNPAPASPRKKKKMPPLPPPACQVRRGGEIPALLGTKIVRMRAAILFSVAGKTQDQGRRVRFISCGPALEITVNISEQTKSLTPVGWQELPFPVGG